MNRTNEGKISSLVDTIVVSGEGECPVGVMRGGLNRYPALP